MKRFHSYLTITLISITSMTAHANYISRYKASPLYWSGYIQGEDISNGIGGIKRGSVLNGNIDLVANYPLKNSTYFKNGLIKVGVLGATHTQNQNEYTGAIQSPSSYTSQREIRISNLSYQYTYSDNAKTILGIMDICDNFNLTENANNLLNNAFTNTMTLVTNTQLATYPYPGFGAVAIFNKKNTKAMFALFQGAPQHQWSLFHEGFMLIGELRQDFYPGNEIINNFSIKLGGWIYQQSNHKIGFNSRGLYVITQADLQIDETLELEPFVHFGYGNESPKYVPYSLTAGFRVPNIFFENKRDSFSFGYGQIWIENRRSEVAYEVSYALKICPNLLLTPDMQIIDRPSGMYQLAWVFSARLAYTFGK
jgi:carbohydrate-selective porin OprB